MTPDELYAAIAVSVPTMAELREVLRAVTLLHRPVGSDPGLATERWVCEGCDGGEFAVFEARSPCSTLKLIANHLDIK